MSEVRTLKCDADGCGKLRVNDANHWLQGSVKNDKISVATMSADILDDIAKHFCGAACAQRWFAGELQKLQS